MGGGVEGGGGSKEEGNGSCRLCPVARDPLSQNVCGRKEAPRTEDTVCTRMCHMYAEGSALSRFFS